MPRTADPKCLQCSKQIIDVAKQKECWNPRLCNSKRSRLKNRNRINFQRRQSRAKTKILDVEGVEEKPYAIFYFFRSGSRKDSPISFVQAKVFLGTEELNQTKKFCTKGMNAQEIKSIAFQCLKSINNAYQNIQKFAVEENFFDEEKT